MYSPVLLGQGLIETVLDESDVSSANMALAWYLFEFELQQVEELLQWSTSSSHGA